VRKLLVSVSVLLIALGLLGCRVFYSSFPTPTVIPTQAAQTAQRMPKLTGNWQIRMTQSGGFAGVSRRLEISSSGEMTIIDERSKKQRASQLPPDMFAMLKEMVASTIYHPPTKLLMCEDCFVFELKIENGTEQFQVQIDELNLPNSGLETLIGFLEKLLNSSNNQ